MKISTIKKQVFVLLVFVSLLVSQSLGLKAQTTSTESSTPTQRELLSGCSPIRAEVLFPVGSGRLNLEYENNKANLFRFLVNLKKIAVDTNYVINRIVVTGSSSPEGNSFRNRELAHQRAASVRRFLVSEGKFPSGKIELVALGENWPALKEMVKASDMPRKAVVLDLMERHGFDYESLKKAIIRDEDGRTWDWMYDNFFPQLRRGAGGGWDIFLSYDSVAVVRAAARAAALNANNGAASASSEGDSNAVSPEGQGTVISLTSLEPSTISKPLFALKTNLLFDAASMVNVELEVPIGKRYSVAAEVIAPWWLMDSKQHCLQLFNANVEGRYWFGNRDLTPKGTPRVLMTGWFVGLYAGGGYYDLEWNKKGYQGEFFIAAGVSGGYAHTINSKGNLRMEYSLGIGFLQTNYREYLARLGGDNVWRLYRQQDGRFSWFGPTRAKVSLVWMLNRNVKQSKGGR